MTSRRWRSTVGLPGGVLLAAPLLADCRPKEPRETAPPLPSCASQVSSLEGIAGTRWETLLTIDARAGARLRGGLRVALSLKQLATALDDQLRDACNGLARDLGGSEGEDAQAACLSALAAVRKTRSENGPSTKYWLELEPPRCTSRMDVMATCASECDAQAAGRAVEVRCEGGEIAGECSEQCQGACDLPTGGRCEGECHGTCHGEMEGICNGLCEGKCARVSREDSTCLAVCQGRCRGETKGTCRGTCKGGCQLKAGGSCPAICRGTCSSAMKAPRCSGKLTPQEVAAECATACEALALAQITCSSPEVRLRIDGSSDAGASSRLKSAIEKNLGAIRAISVGMRDRLGEVADRGHTILASTREATTPAAGDTGDRSRATRCLQSSLPAAFHAVESVRANVRLATDLVSQSTTAR